MDNNLNTVQPAFIQIWSDGSCYHKTREGGIGIYVERDGQPHIEFFKGVSNTSIGRMELFGILMGMRLIEDKQSHLVELYCDSQYAVNCMNGWIESWSEFAFIGKKNEDLLRALLIEKKQFKNISFKWIKGHKDNHGNLKADDLANKGYKVEFGYRFLDNSNEMKLASCHVSLGTIVRF